MLQIQKHILLGYTSFFLRPLITSCMQVEGSSHVFGQSMFGDSEDYQSVGYCGQVVSMGKTDKFVGTNPLDIP